MALPLLLPFASKILDKFIPNKGEREKAKLLLLEMEQKGELKELEAAMEVITAEAKSDHWLAAN